MPDLTPAETRAIRDLKNLARRWPRGLGVWGGVGDLIVCRLDEDAGFEHADGKVRYVEMIKGIPAGGGDPDWSYDDDEGR